MGKGTLHAICHDMGRGQMERGIALDAAKVDIAARIQRVCGHYEDAEFGALVDRMAEIEVRYRLRDDWVFYRDAVRSAPSGLN